MKGIRFAAYILVQCTWGLLQTLAGAAVFMLSLSDPHDFYHGCLRTKKKMVGGVSLGLFIFVSGEGEEMEKMSVHEYGHTLQSLLLGPLYLPVIGVVSGLWCALPVFERLRREKHISYYACFTESWANVLGEKALRQPSANDDPNA